VKSGVERRARNGAAMSEVLLSLYQGVREPDGGSLSSGTCRAASGPSTPS
jgi:hypothetical protein